jgi:hypothetical protein
MENWFASRLRQFMSATSAAGLVCDLTPQSVIDYPFTHVQHNSFIEPEHYAQLCRSFPTCPPKVGPTGYSLYWGDDKYEHLLRSQPTWRTLFDTFHSQRFVDWCRQQFLEVWKQEGCRIDLAATRYVPFREDRIDKERPALRKVEYEPHEVWVRMDIHQGQVGYDRPVHLDHARRLVSMLIYFCDQDENQMEGGELFLYSTKHDRNPVKVTPAHNRMIAFPCTSRSFHSVSAITSQNKPRNYVQVHLSSSVDVWPREPVPVWKQTLSMVKQTFKGVIQKN